jgi:membrane protein
VGGRNDADRLPERGSGIAPPVREPPAALRRLTDRYAWTDFGWRVVARVTEVHGGQLSASITLSGFLAMFPLALGVSAIAGFVVHGSPHFVDTVIDNLGLEGTAADTLRQAFGTAEHTRGQLSVISALLLLWAGLGIVRGLEATFDTVWQVRGRGMRVKLYGLLWLLGAGVILFASIALTAFLSRLPPFLGFLSLLLALAVNFALWLWTFKALTNRSLPLSAHAVGAAVGAIGLLVLAAVGAYYVPRAVASASALYGTLGVVLALLAWFLLLGRLIV